MYFELILFDRLCCLVATFIRIQNVGVMLYGFDNQHDHKACSQNVQGRTDPLGHAGFRWTELYSRQEEKNIVHHHIGKDGGENGDILAADECLEGERHIAVFKQ